MPRAEPSSATSSTDLSGTWRAHEGVGDLHQRFVGPGFDDSDWADIEVPAHWRSTKEFADSDGPLLYRRQLTVDPLEPGRRRFLVLDGIFYYGDVWLDADYLGATEGYFFSHSFEVSELDPDAEHTLALEVDCPPQRDRTRKRLITGVFSHWDNLDPSWNPGGIWRPVGLEESGPVRIERLRVACVEATAARARLQLDVTLDAAAATSAAVTSLVRGPVPDDAVLGAAEQVATLAAGENTLRLTLDVDDPPRWWPHRFGDLPLCNLEVAVALGDEVSDSRTVRTALRDVRMRRWRFEFNGEPLFVMGSNHGPTRMQLAEATADELAGDVQLAVEANLDLLRIHAHVTRPELYDAADESGLLLWQDFPLQWGYSRIRKEATRQAREMIDALGHHPSIVLWCAHNEPLAVDFVPGETPRPAQLARAAASMFLPSWNKDVLDRSVARAIRRADQSRPVDLHSGVLPGIGHVGSDSHFYFGWYHGRLDGLAPTLGVVPRLARFVSEFGAQAVPANADFMEPERWPDLDWDHLAEHHSCQKAVFDQHIPPIGYATFDAWRAATQEYQAAVIQLQIEDLRRIRFDPTGGFCHFCFGDGHPSVTWSVLDHERGPKRGYGALRDACRPVLPMVDPRTGAIHVVNETRATLREADVSVDVDGTTRKFRGDVAAEAVTFVGEVGVREARAITITLEHPDVRDIGNAYGELLLRLIRAR